MIILTPNRRLTAFSLQKFNAEQLESQHKCWPTPEIYPLDKWLSELWNACADYGFVQFRPLLTPNQQRLLFEQIIQQADLSGELLRVAATAQNAIQAWGFLKQWQVDLNKLAAYADYSADTAAFYVWLQDYLHWLDENEYYDFHLMVEYLIELVPKIKKILPAKICLRGFNELTPQYAKLFMQFKEQGVDIIEDQLTTPGAKVWRSGFLNSDQELYAAAKWTSEQLNLNEDQIIGVVIPDLEQQREHVHNVFTTTIHSAWLNVSAPLSLSSYNLISNALLILKLAVQEFAFEDFSILLRSPFIADFAAECNHRALLDRRLREKLEAKTKWQYVLAKLDDDCDGLKNRIETFYAGLNDLGGKHPAQYWVGKIQNLLQSWGWPGERLTTIDEHKQSYIAEIMRQEADLLACWNLLLEEYCKLELVMSKHTFAESLQIIRRLANETPFSPSETGLTKVHVLGMLEAEGLMFDQLWICGMSRDSWPQAANPNPFIPIELQREFDLPHSSPQRELAMAKKYTANLQQGAKHAVIFSYPKFIEDHSITVSNLIAHLPELEIKSASENVLIPDPLESWQDTTAPPFTEPYISGGAVSLRLQAQCPFKANAELRLNAKPLVEPQTILTPAMRGSIVHEVLETFWHKCNSHAQLVAYSAADLESILNNIIEKTLQAWQHELPLTLTSSYMTLEAQRLYKLIARWLEYETERDSFVIYQLENKTLITIGALQINMKIDRIDQLPDGKYVIIDYKTGETQVKNWFSDPIYEPQLPIYAVSIEKNIVAVAFASLRSQELKFIGVAEDDGLLPNVKAADDWSEIQKDWMQKLKRTAQDFVAGNASVAPYSEQVCNICKLQAMCRIYEQ